jgi:Protein of unknown function (DUF4239)
MFSLLLDAWSVFDTGYFLRIIKKNYESIFTMNLFWVYDLPNIVFANLVMASFIAVAVLGQRLSRRWVKRVAGSDGQYNELVGTTLATVGVFFGITLGLISVGAWQNFADVNTNVNQEISSINVIYRSVSLYPEPSKDILKSSMKEYVKYVIDEEWPAQRKGIIPRGGTDKVTNFQKNLYAYEPVSESMKSVHAETIAAFNEMIKLRRTRLQSVTTGLPSTLWLVVIFGSLLNIVIPWFLVYDRQFIQDLMIILMAATIGLLVFLMAAMDYPFRGEFSVSIENFQLLYDRMVKH